MLKNLLKPCTAVAGIVFTTIATTGHTGVFGPDGRSLSTVSDAPPPVPVQSARNAGSLFSSDDWPFTPRGSVVANPPVYGKTYGEWGAEWWKWAVSFPKGENPVEDDETGELCDLGQSGPVWFLAGTVRDMDGNNVVGVERNCTIPAGKAIFFPLVNSVWIDEEGDEIYSDEFVRYVLANFAVGDNACQLTSTLDTFNVLLFGEVGAPISGLLRPTVRSQSPRVSVYLPEGNVLDFSAGISERLIADGYWVMLPPLAPGEHILYLHGATCLETEDGILERDFETEVTYHLTVLPPQR